MVLYVCVCVEFGSESILMCLSIGKHITDNKWEIPTFLQLLYSWTHNYGDLNAYTQTHKLF